MRGGLIIAMAAITVFQKKKVSPYSPLPRVVLAVLAALLISLLMAGYTSYFYYNIVIYPLVLLLVFWVLPEARRSVINMMVTDNMLGGLNASSEDFSFSYTTEKGRISIDDIRTATFIEGSAKAGKTASIIVPTIVQAAQKGYAGLIYDYEGNLKESGGGFLSSVAYRALRNSNTQVMFAVINFTDLSRTMRCNPMAPKYISSYNHAFELATVIMYNINRTWSRNTDFWAQNAIAAYAATIWFFRRNLPSLSTIPHSTEFLLNDFRKVLPSLKSMMI